MMAQNEMNYHSSILKTELIIWNMSKKKKKQKIIRQFLKNVLKG